MKANLLPPGYKSQERSPLKPNANSSKPVSLPDYSRSGSRVARVLQPLDQLSQTRKHLYSTRILTGDRRQSSQISRYLFEGDQLRGTPIRIGIFAGLRGDDEVGPGAVATFLEDLVAVPYLGNSFRIYAYPIVSARSFEAATPCSRPSQYIINQVGCKSLSSETYQIEREIFAIAFDGIITIRLENEIKNFKVGISDAHLHDILVCPILASLEPFLPTIEDGNGDYRRSLTAGMGLKRKPFELTLQIPSSGWSSLHSIGLRIALHTVIDCYRRYLAQSHSTSSLSMAGVL